MSSGNIEDERSAFQKKWDGFRTFIYNPTDGTVMGRSGKSWAKILIFYMFYYGFLACLFAASISIVLNTLDEYTPKYQTRLQYPGVAIQPKTPSNVEQTSDIKFNMKDSNSYARYVTVLNDFLEKYDPANQTNVEIFQDCAIDQPPMINQEYEDNQAAKACRFDKKVLGKCATPPYGYDEGNPCILVKVNRIINWYPIGYTDLSEAVGTDSKAPPLSEVLAANGNSYKPYLMYTTCYAGNDAAQGKLGDVSNTVYYPNDNGFPFTYFPYRGNKRQPGYLNPLVAVQFTNVTRNEEIKVNCKIYARNIVDNKDQQDGFFSFILKVDEE